MEPADTFDVESLLIYQTVCDEDEGEYREVIGVKEFHVAKALLEGRKEHLAVLVESSGRQVHIFDILMEFGHTDTAWALVQYGVEGCRVQPSHLGPYKLSDVWPYASSDAGSELFFGNQCRCNNQTETCDFCSLGWEIEEGTWMQDWNEYLRDAEYAAIGAVRRNVILGEIMSRPDMIAEECFSAEAMARLLDVAILTGHREAAVYFSRRCQVFPWRRWRADDAFGELSHSSNICMSAKIEVVIAALASGADIHRMQVMLPDCKRLLEAFGNEPVPFQTALFLSGDRRWHECVRLCPPPWEKSGLRRLRCRNELGYHFLCCEYDSLNGQQRLWLSKDKAQAAGNTGVDMRDVSLPVSFGIDEKTSHVTLLGMAILWGEPDCAVEFLRLGVDSTDWEQGEDFDRELKCCLQDETNPVRHFMYDSQLKIETPASACRSAAKAAGMVALIASWKREAAEKGVLIIQLLKKMLGPKKSFPNAIVNDILCFSAEVPKFVEQLDLWDLVDGWTTSATGIQDGVEDGIRDEPEVRKECGETCDPPTSSDQQGASSPAAAHNGPADAEMEDVKVDEETTQNMLTALRNSRTDERALNADGVYLFRVTRSSSANDLLLDADGPLAKLHSRVLTAGCEVSPEWSPVKALFVPITEDQLPELQDLADQGFELNRNHHILALRDDEAIIKEALKNHLRWKNRPKLLKVAPQPAPDAGEDEEGEEADAEPLLVLEGGLRTDSDVGFGGYQL